MTKIDLEKIGGIGKVTEQPHGEDGEDILYMAENGKVFLVLRPKTLEVRCEAGLKKLLTEKYETVMESRYFGRGGIEIIPAGQLGEDEINDLVRLSYNLTREMEA